MIRFSNLRSLFHFRFNLPAQPLENVDRFATSTDKERATSFWQSPYAAKRILFSATFAARDGTVPAYKPRTIPSFLKVSLNVIMILH